MDLSEGGTLMGQIALAVLTIVSIVLKEMSDRRREVRAAAALAAKNAEVAQEVRTQAVQLEKKLDENTAITAEAAKRSEQAVVVANNFNEKLLAMQARYDATLAARQASQLERIDHTTTESKDLLEDLHAEKGTT